MWCKSLEVLNPYEALKEATMPDLKPCPICGAKVKVHGQRIGNPLSMTLTLEETR